MCDLQRLIYLSGLLKVLGEKDTLDIVINQLKQYENGRTFNIVKNHLRALEEWNSNVFK